MYGFLSLQIIAMKYFLITVLAAERSLISVDLLISFRITLRSECFVTVLAAEWYLSGVDFFKLVYKLPYVWNTLTDLDWLNVFSPV